MSVGRTITCLDCGTLLTTADNADPGTLGPCPKCGSVRKNLTESFEEGLNLSDAELDLTAHDADGKIRAERISRDFGHVRADLATDFGEPSKISSSRTTPVNNFEDEAVVSIALAQAFNAKHGTNYVVKPKEKEDSQYEDRVLISSQDHPQEIPIQIRHLDTEIIKSLGKEFEFIGTREASQLAVSIQKGIESKAQVDAALKSSVVLLLQIPTPLGKLLRRALEQNSFNLRGFKAVWIAPFHEEPFEVFALPAEKT